MQQYRHVAELLRNLMSRHCERRTYTKRNRRAHGRADDHSVEKIMKGVADDHPRRGHAMCFAIVRVAVPPQHELFEQKRIDYHPVFPGRTGFGARRIETDQDVADVIQLMRLNYDRVVTRHGLPADEAA